MQGSHRNDWLSKSADFKQEPVKAPKWREDEMQMLAHAKIWKFHADFVLDNEWLSTTAVARESAKATRLFHCQRFF
jgi:hypothetical protein